MMKLSICMVLTVAFLFIGRLAFSQDSQAVSENDTPTIYQEDAYNWENGENSEASTLTNAQDNSGITLMPFAPQDNSVSGTDG